VFDATSELMTQNGETRPGYIVKDALLKLIKDAIDYDSKNHKITKDAYKKFRRTLIKSRILFVSEKDKEFLTLFNEKLKEKNNVEIDEKEHYSKNDYFKLKFFEFKPELKYAKQFHYLVHSVHNTELLPYIFTNSGIQLKGHFNKDYHGLPLIWFGYGMVLNENKKSNTSRYGSFTFKIDIDKVLAKGSSYFAIGTRIYTNEHSHSILITNREQIRIQTKLKKTDYNKNTKIKKFELRDFEHDFPRIVNIQKNELCKKENNEWFLNDGLQLDDTCGDWDHPEFCLEANEESVDDDDDNNDYANFDLKDIKICFLEHGGEDNLCVKIKGKKTGCPSTREKSMDEFLALMKSRKIPSFLKLRNCFDEKTFQELFQLQFGDDLLEFCKFEMNVKNIDNLNNIQARFNDFKESWKEVLEKLNRNDSIDEIEKSISIVMKEI
jgi:hypothetical protein